MEHQTGILEFQGLGIDTLGVVVSALAAFAWTSAINGAVVPSAATYSLVMMVAYIAFDNAARRWLD